MLSRIRKSGFLPILLHCWISNCVYSLNTVFSPIVYTTDQLDPVLNSRFVEDIASRLTENDIVDNRIDSPSNGLFRSVFRPAQLWKNGVVPFIIDKAIQADSGRMGALDYSFTMFREFTCINFRPRRPTDVDYIRFVDGGHLRCFSYVGRVGGEQSLSLGSGCEVKIGIIIHELLHALGIIHEHSRPDREDFVHIQYANIKEGKDTQFQKFYADLVNTLDYPYDYNSIMHYRQHAFSRNGKPTIYTTDIRAQDSIGQRKGFSACDLAKINRAYSCPINTNAPPCIGSKPAASKSTVSTTTESTTTPPTVLPTTTQSTATATTSTTTTPTTTSTSTTSTTTAPSTSTSTSSTSTKPTTSTSSKRSIQPFPLGECKDQKRKKCRDVQFNKLRCIKYPGYYMIQCPFSCNNCERHCEDTDPEMCHRQFAPYCTEHKFVRYKCPRTCGLCDVWWSKAEG